MDKDADWLSLDKTSGSGSDVITVSVTENKSGSTREAHITISAPAFKTANILVMGLCITILWRYDTKEFKTIKGIFF